MKLDLIVFGEDWGGHPTSTQHIVGRLAAERRVLWINSIGMRSPRLTAGDLGRVVSKVRSAAGMGPPRPPTASPPPAGIEVMSAAAISWPSSRLAQAVNRRLLANSIRPRIAAAGLRRPILWTSLPTALPAVGQLGESAVVYYCGDDFGALAGVDHAPVMAMEKELVRRADLIVVVSETLRDRMPREKTILVPHGVDAALFGKPVARPADLPSGRPIAGFYGLISDWIDLERLVDAARAMPDWLLVLIGETKVDASALLAEPNVLFLGRRPHHELPGYVQHWTVSMLPFRDNEQIRASNPLKLREYLAAGTPIVSADFPSLAPYRHLVEVVPAQGEFAPAILVAAGDTARREVRQAIVAAETWDARASQISDALDGLRPD